MKADNIYKKQEFEPFFSPLRELLLEELHKAKLRLNETPQPYCELDCPWLSFCLKIGAKDCILSELISSDLWGANHS
ncbi:MAG: hypothetical protein ACTSW1_19425 [Candidatus Hodarchaeales archaeon]